MHNDPNDPDAEQGSSGFFPMILAVVFSVIVVWLVVSTTRNHAVSMDEGPPRAAATPAPPATPTQPAPTP